MLDDVMEKTKRILVLTHPECDYGGAMLVQGLYQYLGSDASRLVMYPLKFSYHDITHHYQLPGRDPGMTAPLPWFTPQPCWWANYTEQMPSGFHDADIEQEIVRMLREHEIEAVLLESGRPLAIDTFYRLRRAIREANVPIVMHDGEDFQEFRTNLPDSIACDIYLKREVNVSTPVQFTIGRTLVQAFPFSTPYDCIAQAISGAPDGLQHVDLAFCAGMTHPFRQQMANLLRDSAEQMGYTYALHLNNDERAQAEPLLGWAEYLQRMSHASVAINIRGWGWDTVRHWEIPCITAMASLRPNIQIPHPYQHGTSVLYGDTCEEVLSVANSAAKSRELRDLIFENGVKHTLAWHTNMRRAEQMFEAIAEWKQQRRRK